MKIGDKVKILNGFYSGEWGRVIMIDAPYYHIALWDGDTCIILELDEIEVLKNG